MCSFFFFNDTATTEIYTLSLHDALPIYRGRWWWRGRRRRSRWRHGHEHHVARQRWGRWRRRWQGLPAHRSEEHTSELQSLTNLVCRLLLEKKKNIENNRILLSESPVDDL